MKLEEDDKSHDKIADSKQQGLPTTSILNGSKYDLIHNTEENLTINNEADMIRQSKSEYKSDACLSGPNQCSPPSKPSKGIVIKLY